jgi:hypothetical protein
MEEQIQCPNCGGFRVKVTKDIYYGNTENFERASIGKRILLFFPWYIVAALSIGFIGLPYLDKDFRVWMGDFTSLVFKGRYTIKDASHYLAHNECVICGYKWEWDSTTPKPKVMVRPGLIATGEKKLQEEEEERRRRA